MNEIKGNKFLTITGNPEEIYRIVFTKCFEVDVINSSEGDLYIGDSDNFAVEDGVANYAVIKSGSFYNGLCINGVLYLKFVGTGDISIIRLS